MSNMMKVLKADVYSFFRTLGERDCFRTTGDCSFRSTNEAE